MHDIGGKLEAIQRVYRLTLTPELSGLLSSNQNMKKKTIGSSGNTVYNRKENAKIKTAEINVKLNDKKNRDKLRKEDSLLSNSDGAKVRVTLEEMHGWGGDYHFGTDRDDEDNKEISKFQNTLLTSTSTSTSSLTSTPLNTFSKTSKFGLKNDLRELRGDVLKRSTSLLTENKEENENEIDSRRFVWDNKEVLSSNDRDGNHVKDVVKVEGVRGEVGVRNGAPIGVTGDTLGYTPTIATGGKTPGVRVRGTEGRGGKGLGSIEAQNIVQTKIDNEVQKQGQGQEKVLGKGNLITYIRMTAFDRIGSKVLVNILDDQVRTYVRSITPYVHFTFKTSC